MKNKQKVTFNDKQITDEQLFQEISKGKYKAMEILFDKYYNRLCNYGLLFEKDLPIVEEKIADVFILLWNNRYNLNNINNPKSYIYVIVKNRLKKSIKADSKHSSFDEIQHHNKLVSPSVEQEIINEEELAINQQIILEIMDGMPKQTRKVFELSRVEGYKYREISELMNISIRTVESHIAIALRYVSKQLSSYNT